MDKKTFFIILKKNKKILIISTIIISLICGVGSWMIVMNRNLKKKLDPSTGKKVEVDNVVDDNVVEKDGYKTIALLGVDAGDDGVYRTDTIMLANVNESNGDIQLVSIYRDSFMYVEDWSKRSVAVDGEVDYTKINHAYQMGVDKTLKALNQNLALHITDYVVVDFITIVKVVDAIGGVEVTLPDKDNFIYYLNGAGRQSAKIAGKKYNELSESKRGKTVTLDGFQALGYCRVRKANEKDVTHPLKGESDYTRANRQQEVINKIIDKIKSEGLTNGITLINKLVEICGNEKNMSTSFTFGELKELAIDALKKGYSLSDEGKSQFPFKPHEVTMWSDLKRNNVSTQFSDTSLIDDVRELHTLLYPDKEITDKELENVQKISEQLEIYEKRYCEKAYYKTPITSTSAPTTNTTSSPTVSEKTKETVSPTKDANKKN